MARYVVIEFDNNDEAQQFVDDHHETNLSSTSITQRIVGIFVKPGKTCECSERRRSNFGDKNWHYASISKGSKFGWWVCTRCNRPREGGHQLVNQLPMSKRFASPAFNGFEMDVTGLQVGGILQSNLKRKKKLRRLKHGR